MKRQAIAVLVATVVAVQLSPVGRAAVTVLHSFPAYQGDGSRPRSSLIADGSKLYGFTNSGGDNDDGVIFSINTDGTSLNRLHSFSGGSNDGAEPYFGSLTLSGSALYGMTAFGGGSNKGVIFTINTDGTGFNVLHSFAGGANDGASPSSSSFAISGSTLYGVTGRGGIEDGGTIFSIDTDGTDFNVLHSFVGGANDGVGPIIAPVFSGSKLYGMTPNGGSGSNAGTIYTINTDGTSFELLHRFTGGATNGANPNGSLAASGTTLYGMTLNGGTSNLGTIFNIDRTGAGFGLLHSFAGGLNDGLYPYGSLTLSGPTMYGMTSEGGSNSVGIIFSLGTDGSSFTRLETLGHLPDVGTPYGDVTIVGSALYGMTNKGGSSINAGGIFTLAIPEPQALFLLLAGIVGFAFKPQRGSGRRFV